MKAIAGIFGGLIPAIIGVMLVATTFAASPENISPWGAICFFALWFIGLFVSLRSASAAKAWRKIFISSAVLSFLLPLSGLIYTGSFLAKHVDMNSQYAGAQAVGAAIGGGLLSGFMGFVGFFLGVVFLVIGLLIGRDKQVIYVHSDAIPTVTEEKG